jgi:hypothetical protein
MKRCWRHVGLIGGCVGEDETSSYRTRRRNDGSDLRLQLELMFPGRFCSAVDAGYGRHGSKVLANETKRIEVLSGMIAIFSMNNNDFILQYA